MSNIYLKPTIDKNLCTQNFNFLSSKSSFPGQFLGTFNSRIEFSKFLLQLKNERPERKTASGFSIIFILKEIMTF